MISELQGRCMSFLHDHEAQRDLIVVCLDTGNTNLSHRHQAMSATRSRLIE
jgi:hypothetical protein